MDTIRLKNIPVYAHHGAAQEEQALGQRFYLDVELAGDFSRAAREDSLANAANYEKAYQLAVSAFTSDKYKLLEGAAWQVMLALFNELPADVVTIRIRKPSAPIQGPLDHVELELTRQRHEVIGD